jgi:hypothetical protein
MRQRLTSVPHPRIQGQSGHGVAMYSRSVLVHRPSRLDAAAAVLAVELQYCQGVLAMWARERGHAVDQFDGVMSHTFKCSRLSGYDSEPKFLRRESASNPRVCDASQSLPVSALFCAGRVMAIACDLCLLWACIFAELGAVFVACRWNADARQVGAFRLIFSHGWSPIKELIRRWSSIQLTSGSGSASTFGRNPFSDFVTELLNASRDGSSSVLTAGRRK